MACESLGLLYTGGCSLGLVDTYCGFKRSFDKVPECDNADLNQPKKFRVGPERAKLSNF